VNASDALREFLADGRTEPMTLAQLGKYFECNRNCMRDVVLPTLHCEQVGARYRVNLIDMPPRYWIDTGLMPSFATNCTDTKAPPSALPNPV